MKVVIVAYTFHSGDTIELAANTAFFDGTSFLENTLITIPGFNFDSGDLRAATVSAILTYAAGQSYSMTAEDVDFMPDAHAALSNAPQAAIANAPADAITNYNVLTTLLGSLTSAVNSANTKQNDIATKLNTLLAELRTLGLISS